MVDKAEYDLSDEQDKPLPGFCGHLTHCFLRLSSPIIEITTKEFAKKYLN